MPWKAKRPCRYPGCAKIIETGKLYCAEHEPFSPQAQYEKERMTAAQRGYDRGWQQARTAFLNNHPLCAECERQGKYTPATVVDHIIPHRGNKKLFWDISNWQALCETCHGRKTRSGL